MSLPPFLRSPDPDWRLFTPQQQAAIIAAVAAIAALASAILAYVNRNKVFSPATVQTIANAATQLAPGTVIDIGTPPTGTAG